MTLTLDLTDGKKNIDDMENLELKGWIINKLNRIESQISNLISDYFNPKKRNEFLKILCHNSILNFAAKIKVLNNIPGFKKDIGNKLLKLSTMRNGFAHKIEIKGLHILMNKDHLSVKEIKPGADQIEIMMSDGTIKMMDFRAYAKEFRSLLSEVDTYLNDFGQHVLEA